MKAQYAAGPIPTNDNVQLMCHNTILNDRKEDQPMRKLESMMIPLTVKARDGETKYLVGPVAMWP